MAQAQATLAPYCRDCTPYRWYSGYSWRRATPEFWVVNKPGEGNGCQPLPELVAPTTPFNREVHALFLV